MRCPSPRIRTCLFVLASVAIAPDARAEDAARAVRFDVRTMGTVGAVTVITPDSASVAAIAERALEAFGAVDARLSNWDPHSELSAVNVGLDAGPVELSAETAVVITAALRIARESDGAFDPTVEPLVRLWGFLGGTPRVPDRTAIESTRTRTGYEHLRLAGDPLKVVADRGGMRIDLGGIAKGHAVDLAHAILHQAGIEHALVDLSGNMRALGHPPGRASWTLGVRDPDARDGWFARLRLHDDAVATSGNYEQFVDADGHRYGHVLDPRSGWPVDGLDGVTVLAPTALLADAWATALLVQGPERARITALERDDLHVVLVQSASSGVRIVWVESSLAGRFDLVPDAAGRFEVRWF